MRLVADSGLWVARSRTEAPPLAAVLEVSGAVLSWTIDGPPEASQITLTDAPAPIGCGAFSVRPGHVALAAALANARTSRTASNSPASTSCRDRWTRSGGWPWAIGCGDGGPPVGGTASPALDRALLDVEVALLTAGAQDFFTDDTLDSDVVELLAPHAPALITHVQAGDPRILDLVRAGAGLADEVGVDDVGWPELYAALEDSSCDPRAGRAQRRRDDYALAAGADAGPGAPRTDRPGCRVDQLECGPAREFRCGRGHRRLERRGGRSGGGRRRARGRHRTGSGHRHRGAAAVRGRSAATARWTPTAAPPCPWSTPNSGR